MRRLCLTFVILVLCFTSVNAQSLSETEAKAIVQKYFDAFNRHQVDELVKHVTEDFKMFSVGRDTTELSTAGKTALRKWLAGYFQDLPNVSSEISELNVSGSFVSFTETANWGDDKSQSSFAVYEITDKKINRVWYYY